MEEEARQAKLASGQAGISSQEREKIQQIVEQVIMWARLGSARG